MTTTTDTEHPDPGARDHRGRPHGVRPPGGGRRRRRTQRRHGGDRRPARALPGDGRAAARHPGRAGRGHRHRRALRARVAVGPGGGRLRDLRGRRPRSACPTSRRSPSPTRPAPPACIGAFELAVASVQATDRITDAFRTGDGMAWGDHHHDVHEGCERFFRPGYLNNLVAEWLPALDGVVDALARRRPRGRRGLRPRRLDPGDGGRRSRSRRSSGSTGTRPRSRRRGSGRPTPACPTASPSRSHRPRR